MFLSFLLIIVAEQPESNSIFSLDRSLASLEFFLDQRYPKVMGDKCCLLTYFLGLSNSAVDTWHSYT